ncbi:hypothetical protein N7471_013847 [Penicillium samsonianum]|uniref:uncharacterized protein n=1 Tax=Penicillium samsonianum TaxID=1882272 RepID=UPI002548BA51|nr:uncharacterized protein N7471_013847 [Penicillium samsonianum]KAJ6118380.1 hypothetical protein N7471_013847 [Penicillium samsonianum]
MGPCGVHDRWDTTVADNRAKPTNTLPGVAGLGTVILSRNKGGPTYITNCPDHSYATKVHRIIHSVEEAKDALAEETIT